MEECSDCWHIEQQGAVACSGELPDGLRPLIVEMFLRELEDLHEQIELVIWN